MWNGSKVTAAYSKLESNNNNNNN